MQNKLNPKRFFIPQESWNQILSIDALDDPIEKFNQLDFKTKFSPPPASSQLNHYFEELMYCITSKDIHSANSLIFSYLEIILHLVCKSDFSDSAFFQISKLMFNKILKSNQHISALSHITAVFDFLSSNLPITISSVHLYHINDYQASLILKYLSDNTDYSFGTKCLALSLAFPSSRFTSEFIDEYELSDNYLLLPDPNIMLKNSIDFEEEELIYASFVVQYANSLIFSIGFNQYGEENKSLSLTQCLEFQHLLTDSELSLACLCHSIFIFTTQPSTLELLNHFLDSMRNAVGIELTKELFIVNTTFSFKQLISTFGLAMVSFLIKESSIPVESSSQSEEQNKSYFNQAFLDTLLPFHHDLENLRLVISHLVQMITNEKEHPKVLHFLGALYSCLLRFSITNLSSIYMILIENYFDISTIIYSFFEMLTLQPRLEETEIVRLNINIISLLFETLNNLEIKSFTNTFLSGFFNAVYYLIYLPIIDASFLFFDIEKAVKQIKTFVISHENILYRYMIALSSFYFPSSAVIACFFNNAALIEPEFILKVVEYAVISSIPQIFYITKTLIAKYSMHNTTQKYKDFLKLFFDFYFKCVSMTDEIKQQNFHLGHQIAFNTANKNRTKFLYYLLLHEILKSNKSAIPEFIHHPFFSSFYIDAQHCFSDFQMSSYYHIMPLVSIFNLIWKNPLINIFKLPIRYLHTTNDKRKSKSFPPNEISMVELTDEEKVPAINALLLNIHKFEPSTIHSLLSIVINVIEKMDNNPYRINMNQISNFHDSYVEEFIERYENFQSKHSEEINHHKSQNPDEQANELPKFAIQDFPWVSNNYEFAYIVEKKQQFTVHNNIALPEDQIIEEIEEEETKELSETSDF